MIVIMVVKIQDRVNFPLVSAEILTQDTLLCRGLEFTLTGTGFGQEYAWSTGNTDTQTTIMVNGEKFYTFTITNTITGCSDVATVNSGVDEDCKGFILAPSIFSPNSDGKNDFFNIISINLQELSYLKVYNRWGNLIFETNDLNLGWDGKYNGLKQPIGAYVYIAEGIGLDQQAVVVDGRFILAK